MVAVLAGSNGGSVGGVYGGSGVARLSQVPQSLGEYNLQVLGEIHSCFKQKFGIPRQPGLAPLATAELELKKSVALFPTVFLHFVLFRNNPSTASSIATWYHLLSFQIQLQNHIRGGLPLPFGCLAAVVRLHPR
jgi:hypothetical protein